MSESSSSAADQFGSTANKTAERLSEGAHKLEDAVKRNIAMSKAKMGDAVDMAASRVEDAHAYVSRQAREKPVQTTAIAAGLGVLIGMFMVGRRR